MAKKIQTLVLVLSVSANAAFIGAWAVEKLAEPGDPESAQGAEVGDDGIWCPLHRKLGVTKEQWKKIEPEMLAFHRQTAKNCKKLRQLRSEMIELLAAPEPDRKAVEIQQQKILDGQRSMQDLVLGHLLAEKEILTAEQEKQLFRMLKECVACPGPGRPGMMRFLNNGKLPGNHPQEN